jgi:hypothetical protein
VHEGERAVAPLRLKHGQRGMESEETVEVDHRTVAARSRDRERRTRVVVFGSPYGTTTLRPSTAPRMNTTTSRLRLESPPSARAAHAVGLSITPPAVPSIAARCRNARRPNVMPVSQHPSASRLRSIF